MARKWRLGQLPGVCVPQWRLDEWMPEAALPSASILQSVEFFGDSDMTVGVDAGEPTWFSRIISDPMVVLSELGDLHAEGTSAGRDGDRSLSIEGISRICTRLSMTRFSIAALFMLSVI